MRFPPGRGGWWACARLEVFRDEQATRMTLSDLRMWRENGHAEGVGKIIASVRARLFDLPAFMKELKLRMTLRYNKEHGRKGTLWEGRYKYSLVEDGEAMRAVAAYIDLNCPHSSGPANRLRIIVGRSRGVAVAPRRAGR